jgi:8-oxo-dGTP pyrophosphatase MutT (NUDIX family)
LNDDLTHLQRLAHASTIFDAKPVPQGGAICVRDEGNGKEVLLITSRDTGRWVIPKGSVEKGENPRRTAIREAREEAGVQGKVAKKPLGYYTYVKGKDGTACIVSVYRLELTKTKSKFPEVNARQMEWVGLLEAARRVDEPELKSLLTKLHSDLTAE